MLRAAITGPGGAWISGTCPAAGQDWEIHYGINTTPAHEASSVRYSDILTVCRQQEARYAVARGWLQEHGRNPRMTKGKLAAKAKWEPDRPGLGSIDFKLTGTVDPMVESIQRTINATLAKLPIPPQAFDKDEMLRVLERAKTYDQRPRWKVAVESREVFMAAYGDKLAADAPGRMENLTGTYGSLLGIPVIVDPEIKGWEIRDGHTGEKIQFVTDPATGNRYWFPGHNTLFLGGESNAETGTDGDRSREQAEDAG